MFTSISRREIFFLVILITSLYTVMSIYYYVTTSIIIILSYILFSFKRRKLKPLVRQIGLADSKRVPNSTLKQSLYSSSTLINQTLPDTRRNYEVPSFSSDRILLNAIRRRDGSNIQTRTFQNHHFNQWDSNLSTNSFSSKYYKPNETHKFGITTALKNTPLSRETSWASWKSPIGNFPNVHLKSPVMPVKTDAPKSPVTIKIAPPDVLKSARWVPAPSIEAGSKSPAPPPVSSCDPKNVVATLKQNRKRMFRDRDPEESYSGGNLNKKARTDPTSPLSPPPTPQETATSLKRPLTPNNTPPESVKKPCRPPPMDMVTLSFSSSKNLRAAKRLEGEDKQVGTPRPKKQYAELDNHSPDLPAAKRLATQVQEKPTAAPSKVVETPATTAPSTVTTTKPAPITTAMSSSTSATTSATTTPVSKATSYMSPLPLLSPPPPLMATEHLSTLDEHRRDQQIESKRLSFLLTGVNEALGIKETAPLLPPSSSSTGVPTFDTTSILPPASLPSTITISAASGKDVTQNPEVPVASSAPVCRNNPSLVFGAPQTAAPTTTTSAPINFSIASTTSCALTTASGFSLNFSSPFGAQTSASSSVSATSPTTASATTTASIFGGIVTSSPSLFGGTSNEKTSYTLPNLGFKPSELSQKSTTSSTFSITSPIVSSAQGESSRTLEASVASPMFNSSATSATPIFGKVVTTPTQAGTAPQASTLFSSSSTASTTSSIFGMKAPTTSSIFGAPTATTTQCTSLPSVVTTTTSLFGTSAPSPGNFLFGIPTTIAPSTPSTTTTSGTLFGIPAAMPSITTASGNLLGIPTATSASSMPLTTTKPSGTLLFDSSPATTQAVFKTHVPTTSSSFMFGSPASTTTTTAQETSSIFSKGSTTTTQSSTSLTQTTTATLMFGGVQSHAAPATTQAFGSSVFGARTSATPSLGFGTPVVSSVGGITQPSFGNTMFGSAPTTTTQSSSIFGKPDVSFGSTTAFGAPNTSTSQSLPTSSATPMFGATTQPSLFSTPSQTNITGPFGTPTTRASGFEGATSTPATAFRTPSSTPFGMAVVSQSSMFGTPSNSQPTAFGAPSAAQNFGPSSAGVGTSMFNMSSGNQQTSLFAATSTATSVTQSAPTMFGTSGASSTPMFGQFGGFTAPSFGSTGMESMATNQPTFGSTAPGFGSPSAAPAFGASTQPFQFGAPASSSTASAAATGGFNFAPTSPNSAFQFASSSPPQFNFGSTSPMQQPTQPFAFGTGGPMAGNPAAAPPAGLFSIGTAPRQERRIQQVRRRTGARR